MLLRAVPEDLVWAGAITTAAGLEELQGEWSALWERCPCATPFQRPEWLLSWWSQFGRGELWVPVLRRKDRLAGVAPLMIDDRRVLPLGAGVSDYFDFLLEPEVASAGTRLILEQLADQRPRWEVCEFPDVPPGSPLLQQTTTSSEGEACLVLGLPPTTEELHARLSPQLRRNLRRYRQRLERIGELVFENATENTLDEHLNALFHLHQARWNRRGLEGVLADPGVQRFHRDVAPGMLRRGILRLRSMRLNGSIAAVQYGFACHGRAYFYLAGFSPSLARYSPGTLMIGFAIEESIRAGLRECDFLRGQENYKYMWGAGERRNRYVLMTRGGLLFRPAARLG